MDRLSQSRSRSLRQLLHNEELGDRTPSQLLRKPKALSNNRVTDDVLRNICMLRLFEKILTVSAGDLDTLVRIADQTQKLYPSAHSTLTVTSQISVQQQVVEPTKQVQELSTYTRNRERRKSPRRSQYKNAEISFNHKRFRVKARK